MGSQFLEESKLYTNDGVTDSKPLLDSGKGASSPPECRGPSLVRQAWPPEDNTVLTDLLREKD